MKLNAEPQLLVADMQAALDHYARLGFTTAFTWGEPAFYAQVARGEARLNLRLAEENDTDVLAATITTDDVEGLFREFEAAGVAFHQPLRTEAWGARTFIVADPDGGLILFAGA